MVGLGYDVHKLSPGESLILGGVTIESPFGTVAHSDGDVLIHAIMDAVLGAAGLGDIGEQFPDTDAAFKNADSRMLLRKVVALIVSKNFEIVNIDSTLIMEKPKISPFKEQMKINIAEDCGVSPEQIGVKATTNEKMGFVGRVEGAAAMAVCQLIKK